MVEHFKHIRHGVMDQDFTGTQEASPPTPHEDVRAEQETEGMGSGILEGGVAAFHSIVVGIELV